MEGKGPEVRGFLGKRRSQRSWEIWEDGGKRKGGGGEEQVQDQLERNSSVGLTSGAGVAGGKLDESQYSAGGGRRIRSGGSGVQGLSYVVNLNPIQVIKVKNKRQL